MKRIFLILILIISSLSIYAVENFILEVESGVMWVHNEAYKNSNSNDKDPDPILYRVGVAFPIYINKTLFIRPSLTIISNYWDYRPENNWAMPVDPMWGDLLVLSLLLDVSIGFQLNFKSFSLAFFAAPAFCFRIPAWGDDDTFRENMNAYLLGGAKFLNLSAGFFFLIPISEFIGLTIKTDTWLPIYNIWTDNDLPFSDGLMVSITAGLRFTF